MAYPNFEAWLVDFLQKMCGFNPEDANEIKDEIMKNVKWYQEQEAQEKSNDSVETFKKLLEDWKKRQAQPPVIPIPQTQPFAPNTNPNTDRNPAPWTPWTESNPYIGDPLPGQGPWTVGDPINGNGNTWIDSSNNSKTIDYRDIEPRQKWFSNFYSSGKDNSDGK